MNPRKRPKLRSDTSEEKRKETIGNMKDVEHFGFSTTPYVSTAMKAGGSLDETSRRTMYGKIKATKIQAGKLSKVLPGPLASHIKEHQSSFELILQKDLRVGPRKDESYIGHQITSTYVNPMHGSEAESKTISEPLSPQPHSDVKGGYHRAHAAPFSLVGEESNSAHTVWAPSWANITVDGFIEKRALKAASKGHEVYHYRLDTDTHSTVGFVQQRSSKSKKPQFKSISATYKSRGL